MVRQLDAKALGECRVAFSADTKQDSTRFCSLE